MSTEKRVRGVIDRFLVVVLMLLVPILAGCSRLNGGDSPAKCSSDAIQVIGALAGNPDFNKYAADHFQSSEMNVLWDSMPRDTKMCKVENLNINFVRCSSDFDRNSVFIYIEKMYIDEDAAFVEVGFPPTGMNGDALLRKRSGAWVVTQSSLWEN